MVFERREDIHAKKRAEFCHTCRDPMTGGSGSGGIDLACEHKCCGIGSKFSEEVAGTEEQQEREHQRRDVGNDADQQESEAHEKESDQLESLVPDAIHEK